jgi:hypothetical protein
VHTTLRSLTAAAWGCGATLRATQVRPDGRGAGGCARLLRNAEHEPENAIGRPELERVYEAMTGEFLRRARIAWATAS